MNNIINGEYIPSNAQIEQNGNVMVADASNVYCIGTIILDSNNQRVFQKFPSPKYVGPLKPPPQQVYPMDNGYPTSNYPTNNGYPSGNTYSRQPNLLVGNYPKSSSGSGILYTKKRKEERGMRDNNKIDISDFSIISGTPAYISVSEDEISEDLIYQSFKNSINISHLYRYKRKIGIILSEDIDKNTIELFLKLDSGIYTPLPKEIEEWIVKFTNSIGLDKKLSITEAKDFIELKSLIDKIDIAKTIYESIKEAMEPVFKNNRKAGVKIELPILERILITDDVHITDELKGIRTTDMVNIPKESTIANALSKYTIEKIMINHKVFIVRDNQIGILEVYRG